MTTDTPMIFAIPSKGRLKEQVEAWLAECGFRVEMTGGDVRVTFTLTTPACPIGPSVTEQIEEFVGELEGVTSVSTEMVFVPPWSPERMSEDAKFALGF